MEQMNDQPQTPESVEPTRLKRIGRVIFNALAAAGAGYGAPYMRQAEAQDAIQKQQEVQE